MVHNERPLGRPTVDETKPAPWPVGTRAARGSVAQQFQEFTGTVAREGVWHWYLVSENHARLVNGMHQSALDSPGGSVPSL